MKEKSRKACKNCEGKLVAMRCALCDGTGRIDIASDALLGIGPSNEEKSQECDDCHGVGLTLVPQYVKDLILKKRA
jgi:DnaJ-class molecular chaperone